MFASNDYFFSLKHIHTPIDENYCAFITVLVLCYNNNNNNNYNLLITIIKNNIKIQAVKIIMYVYMYMCVCMRFLPENILVKGVFQSVGGNDSLEQNPKIFIKPYE